MSSDMLELTLLPLEVESVQLYDMVGANSIETSTTAVTNNKCVISINTAIESARPRLHYEYSSVSALIIHAGFESTDPTCTKSYASKKH